MKLRTSNFIQISAIALILFNVLFLITYHRLTWVQTMLGLPVTIALPGLLTIFLMGARKLNLKSGLIAFGLSLLELTLIGLAANYLPEIFGSKLPLNTAAIFTIFDVFCGCLLLACFFKKDARLIEIQRITFGRWDVAFIALSLLLVVLSIFGAFRLNNGGSNILTMFCLAFITASIIATTVFHKKLSTATVVINIFAIALAILLMTSLRSWDITGHDVKTEYMVYTLTAQMGEWSISAYRNAYNACLSITILPVVLTKLLHTNGLLVFKFIFQLFFAIVPVIIFELLRKFTARPLAFLGAILFITYPTFISDSPMLTRQEIAYIFFGLVLIVWFCHEEKWLRKIWRVLFLLMSVGVILTHYSTAYTFVGLLIFTSVMSWIYQVYRKQDHRSDFTISGPMLAAIILLAFFWYAQTTSISKGLTSSIIKSLRNIPNLLQQDNRGVEANYALFSVPSNISQQLNKYVKQTSTSSNQNTQQNLSSMTFVSGNVPPSSFDKYIGRTLHISIGSIIKTLHVFAAKLLQLLIGIGVIVMLCSSRVRKRFGNMPAQYIFLCVGGIVALTAMLVLPNISLDYNLSRALQQSLIFFILPIVAIIYLVFQKIKHLGLAAVLAYVTLSFMLLTGLVSQLTGDFPAQLSLNNNGAYYGSHYAHKTDLEAFTWLNTNLSHASRVHAANFSSALAHNPHYPFRDIGILPFQLTGSDYVLLEQYQVVHNTVYIAVDHNPLGVVVNKADYDNRNLIYASQGDQIYR